MCQHELCKCADIYRGRFHPFFMLFVIKCNLHYALAHDHSLVFCKCIYCSRRRKGATMLYLLTLEGDSIVCCGIQISALRPVVIAFVSGQLKHYTMTDY